MAKRTPNQWINPRVVAGTFYPADAAALTAVVRDLLAQASVPAGLVVTALIAPHAGYACSGPVAAHAYKLLERPRDAATVYLLGPTHWLPVHGVGLSSGHSFLTPVGLVPIAAARVQQWVRMGGQYAIADAAHELDHSLAVQLPFLQATLDRFQVVPMLLDEEAEPAPLAMALAAAAADPATLFVVSSDLSHGYPYAEAVQRDRALLAAVVAGDLTAVARGEACGRQAILCLMHLAQACGWTPHLLAYANSGDTCGRKSKVIGYGAVVYTAALP